ncbi:uncharacterized protein Z518_01314 [Rhinocladiella mackenziei CBS 650.93]|uniref:FAD-binding domain-containing protein n=1 Tax=Rhinocladiella mackenziei CBS 650.93 TaxID=1442369 RepID=A0A0D2HHR6_9EURO|nr:uncharacterized protein Z518_01314 [Rhinocladiella mackenziei CBS 650.93]KIX10233.1 hypothetical protein Z518_01314 [Rhinocladiella mackenziei CBS 650.93]
MLEFACHVAIIGAGLGGLAAGLGILKAGHRVTIIERAPTLGEIGAGIQVPPNTTRILHRWSILDNLTSLSDRPRNSILRSYRDGNILSSLDLRKCSETLYGHPYLHVHRADYHNVLIEEFRRLGGSVKTNSEVIGIDFVKPMIQIRGQHDVYADLVIGADGVKSTTRELFLGHSDPPRFSGDMAYRCVVREEDIRQHPHLVGFLESTSINCWVGPGQHVMMYKMREGDLLNIVIACTDILPESTNMASADVQELSDAVKGWDSNLAELVALASRGTKGRLMRVDEMESWIHPSGKFALLGDACHATIPYLAQGAAQAIEDGAVLGHLFEAVTHPDQLSDLLIMYEALRKPRTSKIVRESTWSRRILHLPDGPIQIERDRQLLEEKPFDGFAHAWADPVLQDYLFSYDARLEVQKALDRYKSGKFPLTTGAWKL